jgi:hypothetical protein
VVAVDGYTNDAGRYLGYTDVWAETSSEDFIHYRIYAPVVADADAPNLAAHHADGPPSHVTSDPFSPIATGDEVCLEVR